MTFMTSYTTDTSLIRTLWLCPFGVCFRVVRLHIIIGPLMIANTIPLLFSLFCSQKLVLYSFIMEKETKKEVSADPVFNGQCSH